MATRVSIDQMSKRRYFSLDDVKRLAARGGASATQMLADVIANWSAMSGEHSLADQLPAEDRYSFSGEEAARIINLTQRGYDFGYAADTVCSERRNSPPNRFGSYVTDTSSKIPSSATASHLQTPKMTANPPIPTSKVDYSRGSTPGAARPIHFSLPPALTEYERLELLWGPRIANRIFDGRAKKAAKLQSYSRPGERIAFARDEPAWFMEYLAQP